MNTNEKDSNSMNYDDSVPVNENVDSTVPGLSEISPGNSQSHNFQMINANNNTGSRPGSANSQRGSRHGSDNNETGSHPGSANSQPGNRHGSDSNQTGSRPDSANSQRGSPHGSANNQTGSRPGSANSQRGSPHGSTNNQTGSRPGSANNQTDNRPGSSNNQNGSRPGSAHNQNGSNTSEKPLPQKTVKQKISPETVLMLEPEQEEFTGKFVPDLEEFPTMKTPDHLGVIEEEEIEELLPIEEVAADMGHPGEDIELPDDEINVPEMLEDLHNVPTQLALDTPPKALFVDDRIPKRVEEQLAIPDRTDYLYDFDSQVKEDVLMIGNISLEEIKAEEQRLREEHVRFQDQEAHLHKERLQNVLEQTEHAKSEVLDVAKVKRKELQKKEKQINMKKRLYHNEVQQAYRKAESQLMYAVKNRRAEVETMFGDLVLADSQYGGNKGRRWKVDWNKSPQPVQIKLRCLRGIKDKLPAGRYVVLVSMYDRIGGHVMRWSNLTGQQWSGSTLPLNHDGAFHNVELPIDQSTFTVCPSTPEIRPSMVFIFEIFLLRGPIIPTDRVVAWGAFPLCDKECQVIEGKYKCPMLRGEIDNRVQSHDKILKLIATDIDNWLCNLYFDVIKLPRYMGGQKEFEVELQFSSSLLGYPDRLQDTEPPKDGNPPITEDGQDGSMIAYNPASEENFSDQTLETKDNRPISAESARSHILDAGVSQLARPFTAANEMMGSDVEDQGQSDGENDYENEFQQVKEEPGLYYKVHREHVMEKYHSTLYKMLPRTALMAPKTSTKKKLSSAEELAEYQYAIQAPFCKQGRRKTVTHERFRFLWLQCLTEVGLSKFRTPEFWTIIFFLFVSGLSRMLIHYTGQLLLLYSWDSRVTSFVIKWYRCELVYFHETLSYFQIIALVFMGPFANIMIFIFFVTTAALCYRLAGYFPNIASQFISAFGVMTMADWLIVLITDLIGQRYKSSAHDGLDGIVGDAFKLYDIFERNENNGLVGIFLTIFIYFFVSFLSGVIFYMYYLRIHLNGRLLDIYVRLTGKADQFFIPHDLEISHAELDYIVTKAEQWRGEEGSRRKTAIYDYIWEEEASQEWEDTKSEDVSKFQMDITTHISIHTLHLDGLRELYRHFLRLSDGAILEVFGEAGYLGLDEAVKSQLKDKFDDMEVVVNTTLNRVTTAQTRGPHFSRSTSFEHDNRQILNVTRSSYRPGSKESLHSRSSLNSRASVRSLQSSVHSGSGKSRKISGESTKKDI